MEVISDKDPPGLLDRPSFWRHPLKRIWWNIRQMAGAVNLLNYNARDCGVNIVSSILTYFNILLIKPMWPAITLFVSKSWAFVKTVFGVLFFVEV